MDKVKYVLIVFEYPGGKDVNKYENMMIRKRVQDPEDLNTVSMCSVDP